MNGRGAISLALIFGAGVAVLLGVVLMPEADPPGRGPSSAAQATSAPGPRVPALEPASGVEPTPTPASSAAPIDPATPPPNVLFPDEEPPSSRF